MTDTDDGGGDDLTRADPPTADPRPEDLRRAPSLVVVNTGPGKGKTTAAMGMVIRSIARNWPVAVVQFLKSGSWASGEEKICRDLGVAWFTEGEGFTWDSEDLLRDQAKAASAWKMARTLIEADAHRLVVLDEVTYPLNWGWVPLDEVVSTIAGRPEKVSVVITGRDAPAALVDIADTVTEMEEVKHAYQSGIRALKGIDF